MEIFLFFLAQVYICYQSHTLFSLFYLIFSFLQHVWYVIFNFFSTFFSLIHVFANWLFVPLLWLVVVTIFLSLLIAFYIFQNWRYKWTNPRTRTTIFLEMENLENRVSLFIFLLRNQSAYCFFPSVSFQFSVSKEILGWNFFVDVRSLFSKFIRRNGSGSSF